jgi:hypothetical protein
MSMDSSGTENASIFAAVSETLALGASSLKALRAKIDVGRILERSNSETCRLLLVKRIDSSSTLSCRLNKIRPASSSFNRFSDILLTAENSVVSSNATTRAMMSSLPFRPPRRPSFSSSHLHLRDLLVKSIDVLTFEPSPKIDLMWMSLLASRRESKNLGRT